MLQTARPSALPHSSASRLRYLLPQRRLCLTSLLRGVGVADGSFCSALPCPARSYGFAIILLTVLVKVATYPLTAKQVRRAAGNRCAAAGAPSMPPQLVAAQGQRFAGTPAPLGWGSFSVAPRASLGCLKRWIPH